MPNELFRASVQYGDFKGTSSADRADRAGPEEFLRGRKLLKEGEFIVGIEVWAGENLGVHRAPITAHFLLTPGSFDSVQDDVAKSSGSLSLRRVTVDMSIAEFMGLFKRFSICLSPDGMLTDRSYTYSEE